jgi:hypothetical protein
VFKDESDLNSRNITFPVELIGGGTKYPQRVQRTAAFLFAPS